MSLPVVLHGNNQSTLDLIKNLEHHTRSKHIDIQLYYLRKVINNGIAKTVYVPTRKMVADIFTKPLAASMFRELQSQLEVKEMA